jgi:hypothetical protein
MSNCAITGMEIEHGNKCSNPQENQVREIPVSLDSRVNSMSRQDA